MNNKNEYIGFDIGAENIRTVTIKKHGDSIKCTYSTVAHNKIPRETITGIMEKLNLDNFAGGAVTGRLADIINLKKIPTPKALAEGFIHENPGRIPATVVTIGAHGFSVLEIRSGERHIYRENGRCSQGTGNFLRQLTERFGLSVEGADELCSKIEKPAPLSGRCPVILKTDMTHLANKGEDRSQILAGLFDAVAENVEVLIKPALAPENVYLAGGVARSSRVQKHIETFLHSRSMRLHHPVGQAFLYYEALGAALEAYSQSIALPESFREGIYFNENRNVTLKEIPSLSKYLDKVKVVEPSPKPALNEIREAVLGFDMGSTGSKVVAVDKTTGEMLWEKYCKTEGNPVAAAKYLVEAYLKEVANLINVTAVGATGSGREIVGSMLKSCFDPQRVFVLNEIAAHAEGALSYDKDVDTIFEIGGQDAKYIRLSGGEIYDSAMNEACSAGTGSFIEEQGNKFEGIDSVIELSQRALEAESGVSLGQHCSVFMAEVIDQALGAGKSSDTVIAGIYDSIIQNYLNRVKGARSIGKKIFCQGMPFSSRALAASVVRQTGREVVIPPNPGLVGALGIALLTKKNIASFEGDYMDMELFAKSKLVSRDNFICKSVKGCGGSGNKCRIDRLKVEVAGDTRNFIWGGSCSLYDKGAQTGEKLPDLAPDPFRERKDVLDQLIDRLSINTGKPVVGLTDEFILKGMLPFFGTFLKELGFDLLITSNGGQPHLKRGIEEGNVPMCAPMSIYGGVLSELVGKKVQHLFMPMIRDVERIEDESYSTVCPLSQASGDIYYQSFKNSKNIIFHRPYVDMGPGNMRSKLFFASVERVANDFGVKNSEIWLDAYEKAIMAQDKFENKIKEIGKRALSYAKENNIVTIVVLGRAYTIYNDVLNSNVPRLLRELGAMAVPVDCYNVEKDVPIYNEIYWGYSQINLRAAHQIRKTQDHYSVFCSNYSCGPDSFNLHFYSYIMEGKPYSIIETDGHSGDAGTKTRLEAFLYCVGTDKRAKSNSSERTRNQLKVIELDAPDLNFVRNRKDLLLIPRMGENVPLLAAAMRGDGFRVEALDMPTTTDLTLGRKHSSGKECLPAIVTLGSLLKRVENAEPEERFSFFMPTANGPCRFGMYNMFHKLVINDLGLKDRVSVVSQPDNDYFAGISKGLALKSYSSFVFGDMMFEALLDTRPVETKKGAANEIFERYMQRAQDVLESKESPGLGNSLMESMGGLFGLKKVLRSALEEFANVKDFQKRVPIVSMVGEIYVRLDAFSNDFTINKLEERGIKVKFAPFEEWLEYTEHLNGIEIERGRIPGADGLMSRTISTFIQNSIRRKFYDLGRKILKWGPRTTIADSIKASKPWIRKDLVGEAILTLGGPVFEYVNGHVDGVVSVGPMECMPNKIAEAQFFHVAEEIGLPSLSLALNGEPMDLETLDNFTYEVTKNFKRRETKKDNNNKKKFAS
jgi:activator of 2-hydroxyglutaryl-CoA dehydratase/predicted nucleotide-binding protein (sugar kinase/HSP70/actin superfamily)